MPITLNSKKYYRTAEACSIACISRTTFMRWVREGIIVDVENRDRKGWRLFTEGDLDRLKNEVGRVQKSNILQNASQSEVKKSN